MAWIIGLASPEEIAAIRAAGYSETRNRLPLFFIVKDKDSNIRRKVDLENDIN